MLRFEFSIPGKTFLIGEYLALQGGPSVVACTGPKFQLIANSGGEGLCQGIHPQSPAGHWIREHNQLFSSYDINFVDPHAQRGGFGASTAQFLCVNAFTRVLMGGFSAQEDKVFQQGMYKDYLDASWAGEGQAPSGADLIAQWRGGLSSVRTLVLKSENLPWSFSDKEFLIISTGQKLATHEHLKNLKLDSLANLRDLSENAIKSLQTGDWLTFCSCVDSYYQELCSKGWVAAHSQTMIEELISWPEVEAAKSCGAMGADTVLVLLDSHQKENLKNRLSEKSWSIAGSLSDLTSGFVMKVEFQDRYNTPQPPQRLHLPGETHA